MRFSVRSSALAPAITSVAAGLPRSADTPTLAGILIEPLIGSIAMSSYDYERSIRVEVIADLGEVDEPVLVSGRLLATVGKLLPPDTEVALEAKGGMLSISCSKASFVLPLMEAHYYPQLPSVAPDRVVGSAMASDFSAAVAAAAPFAAGDPALHEWTAVHLVATEAYLQLTACDKCSVIVKQIPFDFATGEVMTVDVPAGLLADAVGPWKGFDGSVELSWDENLFALSGAGSTSTMSILAYPYPSVETVYPKQVTTACEVTKSHLVTMLSRASAFSSGDYARIELYAAEGSLAVQNLGGDGLIRDELTPRRFSGTPAKVAVNGRRLAAALKAIDTDRMTLGFNGMRIGIYPGAPEVVFERAGIPLPPEEMAVAVMGMAGDRQ
ncbi:DNA polymerase III subunit beta [Mycobacteroides salmoniphilum]|uniref:DNA polymerase III subunit beta n=1 Tax=Mycobacteroides salmoniphilum TaxID=404941 RepID=A0A4R8SBX9_9MYCO|nr:DNA polymerase III subunit beta [Mycobacteroides salmoniphilum]TEA07326.1 DNA polymerase III subunit beta [Mycobacteroides salmoniphilum]